MATTKQPSPKTGETLVAARPLTEAERESLLADAYLQDRVYDALLERGGASKVSEIAQEINNPNIPFALVRRALDSAPQFTMIDRLWNLRARYADTTKPVERALMDVLRVAGKPLSTAQLATELSIIYDRPAENYFALLTKTLANSRVYFKTISGEYGLSEWLPVVDGEDESEVLTDNKLKAEAIKPLLAVNAKVGWEKSYSDATYRLLTALKGRALSHKTLGVLGWLVLREKYNPTAHLMTCLSDTRLVWLSAVKGNGRWITRETVERLELLLADRAATLGEEVEEVAPPTPEPEPEPVAETVVEVVVAEPEPEVVVPTATPLAVTEEDRAALLQVVVDRGVPVEVGELLALQYEVAQGDPSFKSDVIALEAALKADPNFLYVGAGRFREANALPSFVFDFPDVLGFPDLQFVSLDGEIMDEEIEDEGLAGTLRQDAMNPLAQDAGDDEGRFTGHVTDDMSVARLVVKAHHKEIGTFPLCQLPDGFFPDDAPVVEIALRESDGTVHEVIVNNELRLAFNLFDLYGKLEAESGGVLIVTKTARPYEFKVEVSEEPDPKVYLTPQRYADLVSLREQAEEAGDVATFDIACEVLEEHAKGLDFTQLMTEVNVVRRVTRRKLASILSNYYCFNQKAGVNVWRFDMKKRELGTDRSKRQYIKR